MTREQIEAWLALEGWEFFKWQHRVPMFRRGNKLVYYTNRNTINYRTVTEDDDFKNDPAPKCKYTDEQLQLIYQEIIKHEKD